MSSWLRSSQQELHRENKSSLTASLSHRKKKQHCFLQQDMISAHEHCSQIMISNMLSPQTTIKQHRPLIFSLTSKMGDVLRRFTITFSLIANKRSQESKLNDILSVYRAHMFLCFCFLEAVWLHHKSPDKPQLTVSWRSTVEEPDQTITPENSAGMWNFFPSAAERKQRQLVGKQQGVITPRTHGGCSCWMLKLM